MFLQASVSSQEGMQLVKLSYVVPSPQPKGKVWYPLQVTSRGEGAVTFGGSY